MIGLSCEQMRELAPELALGVVEGTERAQALAHLAHCNECRTFVEELSRVADHLLLLAPEAEPPVGFETAVMSRLGGVRTTSRLDHRPTRRALALAAAIVLVVGVAGGVVVDRVGRSNSELNREYVSALRTLGGSSLRATRLRSPAGPALGEAFVYQGHPSWLFVEIHDVTLADGQYRVRLLGQSGAQMLVDGLTVSRGSGSLGWTLPLDVRQLTTVEVVDPAGTVRYQGQLPGP